MNVNIQKGPLGVSGPFSIKCLYGQIATRSVPHILDYFTSSNSISNFKVALGGMVLVAPCAP